MKFLKKLFKKKSKPNNPIANLDNTEIEVHVRRKDGTLKAYRKIKNKKERESFDL